MSSEKKKAYVGQPRLFKLVFYRDFDRERGFDAGFPCAG